VLERFNSRRCDEIRYSLVNLSNDEVILLKPFFDGLKVILIPTEIELFEW